MSVCVCVCVCVRRVCERSVGCKRGGLEDGMEEKNERPVFFLER